MAGKQEKVEPRRACIFCRRRDRKITQEDVLANWIARAKIHGVDNELVHESGPADDPNWPAIRYSKKDTFDWKVAGPCEKCNGGWMSDMEDGIKPTLIPLMEGKTRRLDREGLSRLSQWCFKTALMWDYKRARAQHNRPHYTQAERWRFYRSRAIPSYTHISVARRVGGPLDPPSFATGGHVHIRVPGKRQRVRINVVTIAVHDFAFQVLGLRLAANGKKPIAFTVGNGWAEIEKLIFPFVDDLNWPPSATLDQYGISEWATRWKRLNFAD